MNEGSKVLIDIDSWFTRPLVVIGGDGISIARLVMAFALVLLVLWISRGSERWLIRLAARRPQQFSSGSAYALARIARYVLLAVGFVIVLTTIGLNISSLAVIGGGLGIGIGFGLQTLFANFVSGIVLLLDRSLKVGDFVDLQSGTRGRVVEIAIRYTRISTNDSVDVLVPNSEFVSGKVINWTFNDDTNHRIHIPFGVAYGTDKDLVREAGLAAARRVEGVILDDDKRAAEVWLVAFGDSSLNFELVVWVNHLLVAAPARTNAKVMWVLEEELRRRQIEIPFPQRDINVRSGEVPVRLVEAAGRPGVVTASSEQLDSH